MENNNDDKSFTYTYSAKEQEELKRIRNKYAYTADTEEDKMEQLRRLDRSVTKKGTIAACIIGVIGALILGIGMCLVMTSFSDILGSYEYLAMPIGTAVGLLGIILVILAYPLYSHITKKEREKAAPEILRLTDELLK
ncbi:MAG: hypothetical protein IJ038_03195 [Clostridia bacterium]|nr:hypothetical protein [Clostridia bacterium]